MRPNWCQIALLLGVMVLLVSAGFVYGRYLYHSAVIVERIVEVREVPVEVVREIVRDVDVVREVRVDRSVVVAPDYRLFNNIAEFEGWLGKHSVTFLSGRCGEQALVFVELMLQDGFISGAQLVNPNGVVVWTPVMLSGSNARIGVNIMTIDRQIWYFEPATGKLFYITTW